jgi:DNA-directed RNA polymerase specialized sigma24 family protein
MRGTATFRDLEWAGGHGPGAVVDALARLDGEARLVLALLFVEGLNEAEAAAALDRSVDHVRALVGSAFSAMESTADGADVRRAA